MRSLSFTKITNTHQGAGSSGSTKDTPAKIEEKDDKTLQSCTYKIRFEKGAFKLYKFDGAGGDCGDVMLPVPVNMYEIVACDGIAAIKDGELSFKCSDVFHVLSATTEGLVWVRCCKGTSIGLV